MTQVGRITKNLLTFGLKNKSSLKPNFVQPLEKLIIALEFPTALAYQL